MESCDINKILAKSIPAVFCQKIHGAISFSKTLPVCSAISRAATASEYVAVAQAESTSTDLAQFCAFCSEITSEALAHLCESSRAVAFCCHDWVPRTAASATEASVTARTATMEALSAQKASKLFLVSMEEAC